MTVRIRIGWTDDSERFLARLAGISAAAHIVGLILFSVLPRFMSMPAPARPTIAEIVPASALFPMAAPPGPRSASPSERAAAARKAGSKPPVTPPKPEPAKPEKPRSEKPKPDRSLPPLEKPAAPPVDPEPAAPDASPEPSGDPAPPEAAEPEPGQDRGAGPAGGGISFGSPGGGVGGVPSIGSSAFPYDYYRGILVSTLQSHWRRPMAPDGLAQSLKCRVQFTILKSGVVQAPSIVTSSGNPALDQSAIRAVYDSNPLPPLPFQYGHGSVTAEVVFELTQE
ncbi:MAG TPA: TonB family protein [Candidatus Polarisedimenticolia bacterium]|nr:TonB family protein [Candidatus Polarisedimenticolia bacterium]